MLARFVRTLQNLSDMEPVQIKRVEQELLAGHFFVTVDAIKPEAREQVREILKSHDGHFINFYGQWAVEVLEP